MQALAPPGVEVSHVMQEKAEMLMPVHTFSILFRVCAREAASSGPVNG
jgi:hypothetical protein